VRAEKIGPFSADKVSCSLPVKPCLPVPVQVAMTFAAEPVAFLKVDEFPIVKPQLVPVLCIVAIEAPPHRFGVMEMDLRVFLLQPPLFCVHRQRSVAIAAGKHPFCNRRRGDGKLLRAESRGDKRNR